MSVHDARALAEEQDLDLLLVSETSDPPVCRIINFGQFKYQQAKKDKQNRKTARLQTVKEIKMGLKISDHDYMVRVNRGLDFLGKGYKVKLLVMFRGREVIYPEYGEKLLKRFIGDMGELCSTGDSQRSHRTIQVLLTPNTK